MNSEVLRIFPEVSSLTFGNLLQRETNKTSRAHTRLNFIKFERIR